MTLDDAYAELGLKPDADLNQAKAAWRGLVSRWHPDRNDDAQALAQMQRLNRALEQIRDRGGAGGERGERGEQDDDADRASGAGDPGEPEAGAPLRTVQRVVTLTLEEAAAGCIKVLRGTVVDSCTACEGTGQSLKPQPCLACEGQGEVRQRNWFGWYGTAEACDACAGAGAMHPACSNCAGSGENELARYRVSVRLPPGARDGDVLHIARGKAAAGVALDIAVQWQPHEVLNCEEDGTLRCEWPVDGFGWIANRTVQVPTLRGLQPLALQRGQVTYRLPGQGFPARGGAVRADQIVMVAPRFPDRLSREQERLLDQLARSSIGEGETDGKARRR